MRLLLAEDEPSLSRALVTILEHGGYSVDAVYNGQDALDYLDTQLYDGAILDIMMPRVDGLTVLRELRGRGNRLPVLMLTAKAEVDDRVLGLDSGADDYLTKPFNMKELLARVRAMLRRQTGAADNTLSVGDLSLESGALTLVAPAGKLPLTAKEYQIMEMLMRNPAQIIPTERLMDKIWGYDTDTDISVVWTYISYLRKKLKMLHSDVSIRGVRNVGYTLEVPHD